MAHETSIRLPGRLVGVVRADPAATSAVGTPQLASQLGLAAPGAVAVDARPAAAAKDQQNWLRLMAALTEASAALQAHNHQLAQAVQPLAVELAVAVAARFLQCQVETGDFPLAGWIRQALERLEGRHAVQVLLNPEDLALLQQQLSDEVRAPELSEVGFAGDTALGRGCFRVQVQDRSVRFDLDHRLADLKQHLLESLSESGVRSKESGVRDQESGVREQESGVQG